MKMFVVVLASLTFTGCMANWRQETLQMGEYRVDFRDSMIDSLKSTKMDLRVLPCPVVELKYAAPAGVYSIFVDPRHGNVIVKVTPTSGVEKSVCLKSDGTNTFLKFQGTHWILDENGEIRPNK